MAPSSSSDSLPAGGRKLTEKELDDLHERWVAAWTPREVADRLAGVQAQWHVAAGWAIDLHLGRQTRPHTDIEIAVPAVRFDELRERFSECVLDTVSDGYLWKDAGPKVLAATFQTWLRDPSTDEYRVDVFREPCDGDMWVCRRDPSIRLPYKEVIRYSADGIPYLAPHLALLFKAKNVRDKDQADFDAIVPVMTANERSTLAGYLDQIHPNHLWIARLSLG